MSSMCNSNEPSDATITATICTHRIAETEKHRKCTGERIQATATRPREKLSDGWVGIIYFAYRFNFSITERKRGSWRIQSYRVCCILSSI